MHHLLLMEMSACLPAGFPFPRSRLFPGLLLSFPSFLILLNFPCWYFAVLWPFHLLPATLPSALPVHFAFISPVRPACSRPQCSSVVGPGCAAVDGARDLLRRRGPPVVRRRSALSRLVIEADGARPDRRGPATRSSRRLAKQPRGVYWIAPRAASAPLRATPCRAAT